LEELITYLPDEQKIYLSQKMIPAFLGYEKINLDIMSGVLGRLSILVAIIIMRVKK